ncbi:unnamed protein product [Vicia faba]|uniref:Uncharacterized protein n=1 Tax=Vicia faba TaxID=3906 RepID=A0AAV0ZCY7_VICFA|nr:unnamed protein product [Vicia faba]
MVLGDCGLYRAMRLDLSLHTVFLSLQDRLLAHGLESAEKNKVVWTKALDGLMKFWFNSNTQKPKSVDNNLQEIELQNHNNYLRAKIAEHERAQQQQQNLMPETMCDQSLPSQTYDRNFFPVNLLGSDQHEYSRQDQTALQLV